MLEQDVKTRESLNPAVDFGKGDVVLFRPRMGDLSKYSLIGRDMIEYSNIVSGSKELTTDRQDCSEIRIRVLYALDCPEFKVVRKLFSRDMKIKGCLESIGGIEVVAILQDAVVHDLRDYLYVCLADFILVVPDVACSLLEQGSEHLLLAAWEDVERRVDDLGQKDHHDKSCCYDAGDYYYAVLLGLYSQEDPGNDNKVHAGVLGEGQQERKGYPGGLFPFIHNVAPECDQKVQEHVQDAQNRVQTVLEHDADIVRDHGAECEKCDDAEFERRASVTGYIACLQDHVAEYHCCQDHLAYDIDCKALSGRSEKESELYEGAENQRHKHRVMSVE